MLIIAIVGLIIMCIVAMERDKSLKAMRAIKDTITENAASLAETVQLQRSVIIKLRESNANAEQSIKGLIEENIRLLKQQDEINTAWQKQVDCLEGKLKRTTQ